MWLELYFVLLTFLKFLYSKFYHIALKPCAIVHNSYWKLIDRIFVASVILTDWLLYSCIHYVMGEFPVNERMQNFCNIQCTNGPRISVTSILWVVAEYLRHPVYEWSQNFCDIQCISGRRISATPCVWVVAEFLRHSVRECSQNFCDTQCMSSCRISVTPGVWVVTEFLRHPVYECSQNFWDTRCISGRRISATPSV